MLRSRSFVLSKASRRLVEIPRLHREVLVNYNREWLRQTGARTVCAASLRRRRIAMKTFLISTFVLCLASAAPMALWAADEHHEQGDEHAAKPQQHAPAAGPAASHAGTRAARRTYAQRRRNTRRRSGRPASGKPGRKRTSREITRYLTPQRCSRRIRHRTIAQRPAKDPETPGTRRHAHVWPSTSRPTTRTLRPSASIITAITARRRDMNIIATAMAITCSRNICTELLDRELPQLRPDRATRRICLGALWPGCEDLIDEDTGEIVQVVYGQFY